MILTRNQWMLKLFRCLNFKEKSHSQFNPLIHNISQLFVNFNLSIYSIRSNLIASIIYIFQMTSNIFIDTLSHFKNNTTADQLILDFKEEGKLKIFKGMTLQPLNLIRKFNALQKKFHRKSEPIMATEWLQNERKLFLWFILAYCHLHFKKISEITKREWRQISTCFHDKSILLLQYEALSMEKNSERVQWQTAEEKLLNQCIKTQPKGKWSEISRILFYKSEGEFFKTPKQCREHWFNHMDCAIQRGQWNIDEDLAILNFVAQKGRHWSKVIQLLGHRRTEHMAKNRFSALLNCARKLCPNQRDQYLLISVLRKELYHSKNNQKSSQQFAEQHLDVSIQQKQKQLFQDQQFDDNNSSTMKMGKNKESEKYSEKQNTMKGSETQLTQLGVISLKMENSLQLNAQKHQISSLVQRLQSEITTKTNQLPNRMYPNPNLSLQYVYANCLQNNAMPFSLIRSAPYEYDLSFQALQSPQYLFPICEDRTIFFS